MSYTIDAISTGRILLNETGGLHHDMIAEAVLRRQSTGGSVGRPVSPTSASGATIIN